MLDWPVTVLFDMHFSHLVQPQSSQHACAMGEALAANVARMLCLAHCLGLMCEPSMLPALVLLLLHIHAAKVTEGLGQHTSTSDLHDLP